jgi:hypothetical protein
MCCHVLHLLHEFLLGQKRKQRGLPKLNNRQYLNQLQSSQFDHPTCLIFDVLTFHKLQRVVNIHHLITMTGTIQGSVGCAVVPPTPP